MLALLSYSLTALVESSVSGGFVVALAFICLLQYAIHMHYRYSTRRRANQLQRDIDQLESECAEIRKDRSLARNEMLAMRQFMALPDWRKAVLSVLRRFVSDSQKGFAAFFRAVEGVAVLSQQYGLSAETCEQLSLESNLLARLRTEPLLAISGNALFKSRLWDGLAAEDRRKAETVHLIAVGNPADPTGWILTTALLPADATLAEQQQATLRLVECIAPALRDKLQLSVQDDHLRSSSEMLTMRSLLDQQWESPAQLLEEVLSQATAMIDVDRATLYLHSADSTPPLRSLIRTGSTLAAGVREKWQKSEDAIAQTGIGARDIRCFELAQLHRMQIRCLIGSAMLIPVWRSSKMIGLVCLTQQTTEPFNERQLEQAAWVGQLLAETMPRLGSQAAAERQARLDGLTGLANRLTFDRQFTRDVEAASRTRGVCTLLLLDLDRFKSINDQYGHQAGDEVLRRSAEIVRECAESVSRKQRMSDDLPLAARYGGEELALLLPGVDEEAALRIAEDCRVRIEMLAPRVNGIEIPVTTSIGIATFPVHGQSPDEVFAAADAALYEAKASGRNRICTANGALAEAQD